MKFQAFFIGSLSFVCLLTGCQSESGEESAFAKRMDKAGEAVTARFSEAGDNLKKQGELVKQSCESTGDKFKKSAKEAEESFSEKRTDDKSIQQCRQAAEKGDRKAQYSLGLCYRDGSGVPKDLKQAKYWLEKSASQGHAPAAQALKELK